ncbi:MAG: hypothetical protein WCR69_02315 [Sulfuricurvum sp.]
MLSYHLEGAVANLRDLISITRADIEDIKEARHEAQFDRLKLKDETLKSFESKKSMIDHEILSLVKANPQSDLLEILDETQHASLEELKLLLGELKDLNREYSKLVLALSSLYNSFLERLIPTEMQGYSRVATKESAILKLKA